MLAGHLGNRYLQTSEFSFSGVYDRYLARFARITDDVFGNHPARAPNRVSKRQPLKNDVVNPRPQTRQPGRFAVRVGIQQRLHIRSIGPK